MTIDTARLRTLAERAEHQAWHITTQGGIEPTPYAGPGEEFASVASVRHQGDWEFIAAADPQTVLALLDEIKRLRSEAGVHEQELIERDREIEGLNDEVASLSEALSIWENGG